MASAGRIAGEMLEIFPQVMCEIRTEMRRRGGDLSVAQFRTLAHLNDNPGAPLAEVAERLGLTPSSASALVEGLVEKGLVERRDDPEDRRRLALRLTERGAQALRAAFEGASEHLVRRLQRCSPEQVALLQQAMDVLRPLFAQDNECGSKDLKEKNQMLEKAISHTGKRN